MTELRDKEGRTPGQLVRETALPTSICYWSDLNLEVRTRWERAAQAILDTFGAQLRDTEGRTPGQLVMDAYRRGAEDAFNDGNYNPERYADSINLAPERQPLPYAAEEVARAVINAWSRSFDEPWAAESKAAAIAAAAKFCAQAGAEDPPPPGLNEIRAMAAKHGTVLATVGMGSIDRAVRWSALDKTPMSLTAPLSAPDARLGKPD